MSTSKFTFAFAVAIASAVVVLGPTVYAFQKESPQFTVLTDTFVFCGLARVLCLQGRRKRTQHQRHPGNGSRPGVADINTQGLSQASYLVLTFYYGDPATGQGTGNMAVYNCPAGSNGFYTQCDGALCFTSTQATEFPFFGQLAAEEIICSCPITAAADSGLAFSTAGPFPCEEEFQRDICNNRGKTVKVGPLKGSFNNGVIIGVGAPAGTASLLSEILKEETDGASGEIPEANSCPK